MNSETLEQKVERQKGLESEALMLGQARYNGERMAWHSGNPTISSESDSVPGKSLLKRTLDPMAERIVDFLAAASSGKAGRRHQALPYIALAEPLEIAFIALRRIINHASLGMSLTDTAYGVGTDLKDHLELLRFSTNKDTKRLHRKVMDQLARSTSTRHRLGVIRHVLEKYAAKQDDLAWSKKERILIGSKLIDLAVETTTLFEIRHDKTGRNKTRVSVGFTSEASEWLKEAHNRCALLSPIHLPMVAKPLPWRTPYKGGYLTDNLRPRLMRAPNKSYLDELGGVDLTKVFTAVNAIQETPWRINSPVLDALEIVMSSGGALAGIPALHDRPMPPRPTGIPEDVPYSQLTASQKEDLTEWKASAAHTHQSNAKLKRDRVVMAQKLYVANKFRSEDAIYYPHFVDFRGRVYPSASYLNPQGDDVAKGLLQFAEGKPLGPDGGYWMAVHIAGLFGVDKVSFEDRVRWTEEHSERLLESALSPTEDGALWAEAESPFQALAACYEWLGFKFSGAAHVSHLPIAMDGSCSGLQHFSALLLDAEGGAVVNLVPCEKPADIYTEVAERAQAASDVSGSAYGTAWAGKVGRKIAKQPTMTLCYGATKYGMWKQIEVTLRKLDEDGPYLAPEVDRFNAAREMSEIIWATLGETVVAARGAMDWLQAVSHVVTAAGIPIRWTTPIGLPVMQDYTMMELSKVNAFIGGKRHELSLRSGTTKLSARKQASSIAPNFVHALDSAHLMATVNMATGYGLTNFSMIHDSFGVHACDVTLLNAVLRESFIEQYSAPVLERFRDEIVTQLEAVKSEAVADLPPLPPMGTLDLEAIRDSKFFFA